MVKGRCQDSYVNDPFGISGNSVQQIHADLLKDHWLKMPNDHYRYSIECSICSTDKGSAMPYSCEDLFCILKGLNTFLPA